MAKRKKGKPRQRVKPHLKRRQQEDFIKENLSLALSRKARDKFLSSVVECSLGEFPSKVTAWYRQWELVRAYQVVENYDSLSKRRRLSKRAKRRGHNVQRAYHGTPARNVASIVATRFRLPKHYGMFGQAIYLSPDISKCFGYTGAGRTTSTASAFILVCSVDMGNVLKAYEAMSDMNPEKAEQMGFNTVIGMSGRTKSWGGTLLHTEYAVYDPNRIKVTHILQYRTLK